MWWMFLALAAGVVLAIIAMAHLYVDRRERLMFVKDLSPEELERLQEFERFQGNWRDFRNRVRSR